MYPELFNIGPFAIRSYGVMLAISFFFGVYYVSRIAKRENKDFGIYLTLAYIMVFAGIIGARISYVLFHLEEFSGHWTRSFNPFGSDQIGIAGLNLYGGVILAVVCSYIYLKIKKISVLETFDVFAPTIGLGLAITRIGCFFNGCCFGTPTDLPWGIEFPEYSIPWYIFGAQHIHPSQIYSSLYGLGLFLFLHWRLKKRLFFGQVVALMFMIEAVFRYAIEYVRYYEKEMHVNFLGMSPTYNHLISIGLFLLGLGIYIYQYQKNRNSASG